jgi:formylglycine-generating enzyme required for sulfatase activity
MGSPSGEAGRDGNEGPQRTVRIGYAFEVGKYEVTWNEYSACVSAGSCRSAVDARSGEGGSRPVANVSWEDAQSYITWLNERTGLAGRADRYRLLTEAEWEYAARSGSQARWGYGDDVDRVESYAWFSRNSNGRSQPVGGKAANGFGLHDMHGNVSEWVEDCYSDSYSGAPSDGSARTTGDCSYRVSRGGSWDDSPRYLRSAVRGRGAPGYRFSSLGFRLARTLSSQQADRARVEIPRAIDAALSGRPVAERVFRDGFVSGVGQGPEMVVAPPGSFTMGSPSGEAGRDDDEGPQRTVRIDYAFAVGKYEVTWNEYSACVSAGSCPSAKDDGFGQGSRPVTTVSWEDAQSYITWLNERTGLAGRSDRYRLLTEAEWEYAARAGTTTRWSFGSDEPRLGSYAWFASNSSSRTQPVGGKPANAFGLHDMHGNVWEWVEDCYSDSYSGAPSDGSARTTGDCSYRRIRGGSWRNFPQSLRSADRLGMALGGRIDDLGFRLARTLP